MGQLTLFSIYAVAERTPLAGPASDAANHVLPGDAMMRSRRDIEIANICFNVAEVPGHNLSHHDNIGSMRKIPPLTMQQVVMHLDFLCISQWEVDKLDTIAKMRGSVYRQCLLQQNLKQRAWIC